MLIIANTILLKNWTVGCCVVFAVGFCVVIVIVILFPVVAGSIEQSQFLFYFHIILSD
jgi:hypothetical protein